MRLGRNRPCGCTLKLQLYSIINIFNPLNHKLYVIIVRSILYANNAIINCVKIHVIIHMFACFSYLTIFITVQLAMSAITYACHHTYDVCGHIM